MHSMWKLRQVACVAGMCLLIVSCGFAAGQPGELPGRQSSRPATVSVHELAVPREARDHLERAKRAARSQKEELFEREIRAAIALYPQFLEAYLLLADRENGAGLADAAIEHALKAQAIDAESTTARILLASAYNSKRRYSDALLLLANLRGPEADSWQAMYERARAEVGLAHPAEALLWSRRALEAAPPSCADAHVLMADAYQLDHQWIAARREMEVYLASRRPLLHEQMVRSVLERTRELAEREQLPAEPGTADGSRSAAR